MHLTDWTDIPDSLAPANPDEFDLEFELGTPVKFEAGKMIGGIVVGVNEYGRPIVAYVGPSADGRAIDASYRTTDWEDLEPLNTPQII